MHITDYLSLIIFIFVWNAYAIYAHKKSKNKDSLIRVMQKVRINWIRLTLYNHRKERLQDVQLLNILHRGISFFVSTTILVIAGLLAFLSSGDSIIYIIEILPYYAENYQEVWRYKLLCLTLVFVVCFFRLTWSVRQNQYANITLLSIPQLTKGDKKANKIIKELAGLFSDSANNFNHALRGYYFGISMLTWLISPYYFIATIILVVLVLYRREFKSQTLSFLKNIIEIQS